MNVPTTPVLLLALALFLSVGVLGCQGVDPEKTERDPTEEEGARLDTVLAEGSFGGKEGIETAGSYRIGRAGTDLKLTLQNDFQTESGPDLYVVLSPTSPEEATGENVMDGAALRVDSLRSLGGQQTYDLQDDLALEPFASVAIHCVQFSHLYGTAKVD